MIMRKKLATEQKIKKDIILNNGILQIFTFSQTLPTLSPILAPQNQPSRKTTLQPRGITESVPDWHSGNRGLELSSWWACHTEVAQ